MLSSRDLADSQKVYLWSALPGVLWMTMTLSFLLVVVTVVVFIWWSFVF